MQPKTYTLEQLASLTQASVVGDPSKLITGVADLESAGEHDASFLANAGYAKVMKESSAGVVFIDKQTPVIEGRSFLVVASPMIAFQITAEAFLKNSMPPLTGFEGVHATAVIHPSAKIGQGVRIGPHAVIDKDVVVGDGSFIGSGAYVGPQAVIGKGCDIYPRVIVREGCVVGDRVILQPGVVIGSCGFGYTPDAKGRHVKLTHFANVVIGDDVEIGANTTVDRGRIKPTVIGRGTKIDNLVQVGHAVVLGEDNIIVAQTGIAGSTSTGSHVIIAGQSAINGHIKLAAGVVVAAKSTVIKSIPKSGTYGGSPAIPMDEFRRNIVHLSRIDTLVQQVKELREVVRKLSELS